MLEEVASVIDSSVFIRSKPQDCQTHQFQKLFGVDSACWEEVTSFIPRSVRSLVPSDTIAKHQFQCFFRVDSSCWEEVASFIPRQADFTFWINNNFELFRQIGPSTVASTLLIPTLILFKKMYSMIPQWMPINAKLISTARTPLGGYCRANFDPLRPCMHANYKMSSWFHTKWALMDRYIPNLFHENWCLIGSHCHLNPSKWKPFNPSWMLVQSWI